MCVREKEKVYILCAFVCVCVCVCVRERERVWSVTHQPPNSSQDESHMKNNNFFTSLKHSLLQRLNPTKTRYLASPAVHNNTCFDTSLSSVDTHHRNLLKSLGLFYSSSPHWETNAVKMLGRIWVKHESMDKEGRK